MCVCVFVQVIWITTNSTLFHDNHHIQSEVNAGNMQLPLSCNVFFLSVIILQ